MFDCVFSEPKTFDGTPAQTKQDFWAYSEMTCEDSRFEMIENETTGAIFSLEKTFSYGDFFLVFFLMVFTLFGIGKIIFDKFISRK